MPRKTKEQSENEIDVARYCLKIPKAVHRKAKLLAAIRGVRLIDVYTRPVEEADLDAELAEYDRQNSGGKL